MRRHFEYMLRNIVGFPLGVMGEVMERNRVIILCYHTIDNSGLPYSDSPENFRIQMHYLKDRGFKFFLLREYIDYLVENLTLPDKVCILTFDDGYKSVFDNALPIIKALNIPATLFFTSGYAGRNAGWSMKKGITLPELMTWDEIKILKDNGFDIQAHTRSHPSLPTLEEVDVEREVLGNKEDIESRLGNRVDILAYPDGNYNDRVVGVIKRLGFKGAVTTDFGTNDIYPDLYRLRRFESVAFTSMVLFKVCVWGTYEPLFKVKGLLKHIVSGRLDRKTA